MGLRFESITHGDTPAWSALSNVLAEFDQTDEFYEPEDLAEELAEPGFDPARDTVAVWDDGLLVGYGQLRVSDSLRDGAAKANISGGVHPAYRRRGLGSSIMDRMETRARELGAQRHPGVWLLADMWAQGEGSTTAHLAAARGYAPVRYFQDMRIELDRWGGPEAPSGPDAVPAGEPFTSDLAEAVRRAHNEAFADHWGSSASGVEKWNDRLAARSFRPGLSRVATLRARDRDLPGDPDDAVDAYLLSSQWVPGELYISLVGTRRRARGRGLATRLLVEVVDAAREAGYRIVDLTVDSESPTGAVGLYERVGFQGIRTSVVHQRTL